MIFLFLLLILIALYILSLSGRRGRGEALKGWRYAHRGLHDEERPENSMSAFRAALEHGYGIELDVHLLKDGNLAVLHDSDLQRITGKTGVIEDLTTEQLKDYHLKGTQETIPEFRDVLTLFAGKAPLIVEVKTYNGNYAQLCQATCQMLADYPGVYCMESFDPYAVYWLRRNRPEIIRGQLSENSLKRNQAFPWAARFITTFCLCNFLTCPDFIAYSYPDRKNLSVFLCRKLWGLLGVSWTLRTREQFDTAVQEGWLPIFEGFEP